MFVLQQFQFAAVENVISVKGVSWQQPVVSDARWSGTRCCTIQQLLYDTASTQDCETSCHYMRLTRYQFLVIVRTAFVSAILLRKRIQRIFVCNLYRQHLYIKKKAIKILDRNSDRWNITGKSQLNSWWRRDRSWYKESCWSRSSLIFCW